MVSVFSLLLEFGRNLGRGIITTIFFGGKCVLIFRIQEWALVQAKLRMEEDGVNLDYKVD